MKEKVGSERFEKSLEDVLNDAEKGEFPVDERVQNPPTLVQVSNGEESWNRYAKLVLSTQTALVKEVKELREALSGLKDRVTEECTMTREHEGEIRSNLQIVKDEILSKFTGLQLEYTKDITAMKTSSKIWTVVLTIVGSTLITVLFKVLFKV